MHRTWWSRKISTVSGQKRYSLMESPAHTIMSAEPMSSSALRRQSGSAWMSDTIPIFIWSRLAPSVGGFIPWGKRPPVSARLQQTPRGCESLRRAVHIRDELLQFDQDVVGDLLQVPSDLIQIAAEI